MGQLEKYGVYVLCLVIFLIIGVAIWGDDKVADPRKSPAPRTTREATSGLTVPGGNAGPGGSSLFRLDDMLGPDSPRTPGTPKDAPVAAGANDAPASGPLAEKPAADKPVGEPGQPSNPQGGATPAKDSPRTYRVQSGDSFESIARTVLGDVGRRAELERLNPTVKPTRMQVGQEIVLPAKGSEPAIAVQSNDGAARKGEPKAAKEAAVKVAPTGDRTYVIAKGDTFGRIAQLQLGSSKRIDELRELNPDVDPTRLRIGQRIRLPRK